MVTAGQRVQIITISNRYGPLAIEQRIRRYKKGFQNTAVDLIKVDGGETHQSSIDRTCVSLRDRVGSRDSQGSAPLLRSAAFGCTGGPTE